jgi:hypothetical protein
MPFGGIKTGFSPVINQPNSWVSVGSDGTCQTYSDLYGSPPEWGLTGEGDSGLTQVIGCCIDTEDDKSEASSEAESSAASVIFTEYEQDVLDNFKPQWYGREAGYQGTTYQDALDFCGNVAGMVLCPLMGKFFIVCSPVLQAYDASSNSANATVFVFSRVQRIVPMDLKHHNHYFCSWIPLTGSNGPQSQSKEAAQALIILWLVP